MGQKTWLLAMLLLASVMLVAAGGCYQRVVSSKQYPGWRVAPDSAAPAPTAIAYDAPKLPQSQPHFDPLGDWVVKPLGGLARGVGNLFNPPKQDKPSGDDANRTGRTTATPRGGDNPPSPAGTSDTPPANRSPFDTNPGN